MSGGNEPHVEQPVGEDAPQVLRFGSIAVHDHRIDAAGEVTRIRLSLQLQLFRPHRILSARRGDVGIAAVGAHQPVDHQFQRRRRLVPVHRTHDAMRGHPHRVYVPHPVAGLT